MLEYLRKAADKPLAKFFMFVLVFSFVGWGAAEWIFTGSSRDTSLIHVGNADVSVSDFNNERSRELSVMSKNEQRAVYTDPTRAAELNQSVMMTLTMNQLAMNRAKDMGFVVSDKRIADEIRNNPQFHVNGKFSPWMYDMVLQNAGVSEKDIVNSLRANILRQMAVGATAVPVAVPDFAVDAMYNARYAKRGIKYNTVKFADFKVANPTEEQLREYYVQNPRVVPESRSVSYVFVPTEMNKPDMYDAGFKHAQQIEDLIISGETMKDAADRGRAKYAQIKGIKRGAKLADKVLNDDLIARVFTMDSGVESELLELKDGFVILRVDAIDAAHNAEFDDVKQDLIGAWKKSEQRKSAYVRANEDLIKLNNGEKLKDAKDVSVSRTEGAPIEVLNAAFAGQVGDNAIVEDANAFYVVHIDNNVAPKPDVKRKDTIRKELKNMSGRYVADDYSQFLKRHYPVRINDRNYKKFVVK